MSKPEAAFIGGLIGAVSIGGTFACITLQIDDSGGIPMHGPSPKEGLLYVVTPALAMIGFIAGAAVGYTRGKP